MTSYCVFKVGAEEITIYQAQRNAKVHLAKKVILSERCVSYLTEKGEVFSTNIGPGKWYCGSRWGSHVQAIKDAIALGVLPKAASEKVVARELTARVKRDRAYDARQMLDYAAKVEVALSPTQRKYLQKLARVKDA